MKELRYPANVQWELTPVCNHDCIHCYNYWRNDPAPLAHPDIDYLEIAKIIAAAHPVHVVLTGGEPLLVFHKTYEAAKYLFEQGIYVSWNTNGTLVTHDIAKKMKEINAGAFVSLPSGNAEICNRITNAKSSLDRIARGITCLLAEDVKVSVNMVISSYNIDSIYETAEFAKKLGVSQFCMAPASRPIGADMAFDDMAPPENIVSIMCTTGIKIENELGMSVSLTGALPGCAFETKPVFQRFAYSKSCTAGKTGYSIDAYGNVKACARDSKVYGNLFADSISDIWTRMSEWRDGSLIPVDCKACKALSMCHGGCRLEAFSSTGSRSGMDTFAKCRLIPPPFEKAVPEYQWSDSTMFKAVAAINWIKEDFGWRVSSGPRFTYVTDTTKEWLQSHPTFSLSEMVSSFGSENCKIVKTTIQILANAGIILSI